MQTENHYTETDLGNVSPNPRGEYDNAAKYEYLDLVSMQGGSYLCIAELGQTITGIAPEAGKNTEHWQCVAIPGNMTPEYTDAYDKVVRLAREVEQDAAKVAEDKQSVTQMETNARQLKEQAEESARQAENSKDSAAGSAREAKKAEESARQAENNVRTQVNGFDTHVEEKTTEATQAVATAKDNAVQAVERQETASVQEVKDQTATYITEQKNLAKQELDDKVNQFGLDVNVIKAEVSKEGQKQITNVQEATTAELAKITEKGTEQTEAVAKEGTKQVQAVQTAAQEIIADREQINANKEGVAKLKEDLTKLTKNEYIDLSKVAFEKGKYVNANTGRLEDISSGEASDFIDVHHLKKITILNYSNPDLVSYLKNVGAAFYDKNKLKTTAIQYSDTNNMTVEVSGYYFRFTKFGNPNGTAIHIDNFWEEHISDFSKAKDDIAFLKEKVFPLNPAKYHGKEFLSFSKCACIGDSLTAGVFNSNSAGYTEYIHIEKYSYPAYMKKHFGIEAVNWGKSGETTKGWYEKAVSENWTGYDCAIINLGANDSQLSDSNDSKKYLKMIVDKLKTSNKGIKIFITTLLPNYYSNMGDIRDIVNNRAKEIAAENADCYLVDLTTYSACKDNTVYSQGHLTALGYQKEAEELVAYISYLINQNKNDFKYIHFINTNYSFS